MNPKGSFENFWPAAAALLLAGALPARAQEEFGVTFRTTDPVGAHADRIQIQSSVGLARVQLVNSYLDLGGQGIINVAPPVLPADAANKVYVDAAVGALSFNGFAHVADAAGTVQFSASGEDTLRLSAGSALSITFNALTHEATYGVPAGAITDSHLAGSINPSKITGTALTQSSAFSAAAASDLTVGGPFDSLNVQLKAGSVTDTEIAGTISASKIQDVWVNATGDSMTGQLVANAGLAIPTGQELRYRAATDANWALSTTSALGELYVDLTGVSNAAETRAWRLRDMSGGMPATRFSVNMLDGAVSVTGALSMGGNVISSLGAPVAASDAATKGYVDAAVGAGMGITQLNAQTGPSVTMTAPPASGLSVSAAANVLTINSDLMNSSTASDYVHWNVLAGIPAGFADGTDDNTTYSAGTGLSLAGTTFAASFGTAAGTVAEGNHAHDAAYVNVSGDTMTGPLGVGQAPAADEKLIVVGSMGSIIVR